MCRPVEDYPRTAAEFEARFATEEACRAYLVRLRWPDGFRCPACGGAKTWPMRSRPALVRCASCEVLGLGSYETAWTWLHKLRRAMVRPGRDRLTGRVEVDETYLGGVEEGVRGRQTEKKALIAVAAEEDGEGIGRIRMRRIPDVSADSLEAFVRDAVAPGSLLHTDGLLSYDRLEKRGYRHRITFLKGRPESAAERLPRVHRVVALLKRWLLGTHQGAVSHAHLDDYLDEFTFRFNRRTSRHRGKLFYRLLEQAVAAPYSSLVRQVRPAPRRQRRRRHHNY